MVSSWTTACSPPPSPSAAVVAYPKWFLKVLRQLLAAKVFERQAAKQAAAALTEYERLARERGASTISSTERTRELTGI